MAPPSDRGLVLIGAGLPRTGTFSTRLALERLLGGKCYHMVTLMGTSGQESERHTEFWEKAMRKRLTKEVSDIFWPI
jgi:hypothetical protein